MNLPASIRNDDRRGWLQPLADWPLAVIRALQSESAVSRIVVAATRGSSPREAGTCMLVTSATTFGTIGGGRLEWEAVLTARGLAAATDSATARVIELTLGTELAQCCGGVVDLWIERYTRSDLPLLNEAARAMRSANAVLISELENGRVSRRVIRSFSRPRTDALFRRSAAGQEILEEPLAARLPVLCLYGAGHVGQALVRVMSDLPVQIRWIDARAELFPTGLGDRIETICVDDPLATVATAPVRAHFLIMTHSHALDYSLCQAILSRDDAAFVGLIGSRSKAARFRSRLARDGFPAERIARLTSPIGIDGVDSKVPASIAIATAAQLLQVFERARQPGGSSPTHGADCDGDCATCGQAPEPDNS